jgi:TonB family protein
MPVVPIEIPTIKLAELPPAPLKGVPYEPAPPPPAPTVAPVFENLRADAKPVELPIEPPPAPAPPAPRPRPEVTVGSFAPAKTAAAVPQPAHQIEIAGFDRPVSPETAPKPATTSVGGFDRPSAGSPPPPPSEAAIVQAGFNRSVAAASTAPTERVVRDTGFGTAKAVPYSEEQPRVTTAGFDRVIASPATATMAAPPPPRVVPVEVLFKPTPVYTEEARKLRIEGDVILEVEFLSAGRLRVLRIVRGLGHGLDEAAVQAAEQIRFKPAQTSGRSVDSRGTVNIVFRLA